MYNLQWGFLAGIIVRLLLLINIISQPYSQKYKGFSLLNDLLLMGFAYGIIDGLFLNVMPVAAISKIFEQTYLVNNIMGLILIGFLSLLSSMLITLFYHLGYTEFRNKSVFLVLLGNSIITLAFIISKNPFGAVVSHTIMHIAAVLRGPDTTIQLPPHYKTL